jgi:hypothetical protein
MHNKILVLTDKTKPAKHPFTSFILLSSGVKTTTPSSVSGSISVPSAFKGLKFAVLVKVYVLKTLAIMSYTTEWRKLCQG